MPVCLRVIKNWLSYIEMSRDQDREPGFSALIELNSIGQAQGTVFV